MILSTGIMKVIFITQEDGHTSDMSSFSYKEKRDLFVYNIKICDRIARQQNRSGFVNYWKYVD